MRTGDHDRRWLEWIRSSILPMGHRALMHTMEGLKAQYTQPYFDLVFVDHGPTMRRRRNDLPWIDAILRRITRRDDISIWIGVVVATAMIGMTVWEAVVQH